MSELDYIHILLVDIFPTMDNTSGLYVQTVQMSTVAGHQDTTAEGPNLIRPPHKERESEWERRTSHRNLNSPMSNWETERSRCGVGNFLQVA